MLVFPSKTETIVISDGNFLLMILNICAQKKVGKLEMFLSTQNLATFLVD